MYITEKRDTPYYSISSISLSVSTRIYSDNKYLLITCDDAQMFIKLNLY